MFFFILGGNTGHFASNNVAERFLVFDKVDLWGQYFKTLVAGAS